MGREQLYFAYGSNLNRRQMKRRCPDSKVYCAGVLEGYTLIFRRQGVADVVPCTGGTVFGGLYTVTPQDISALDRCEGVPCVYQRKPCEIKVGRSGVSAFFYSMNPDFKVKKPGRDYYRKIVDGYAAWGIEARYLEEAFDLTLKLQGMTLPDVVTHLQESSFGAHRD